MVNFLKINESYTDNVELSETERFVKRLFETESVFTSNINENFYEKYKSHFGEITFEELKTVWDKWWLTYRYVPYQSKKEEVPDWIKRDAWDRTREEIRRGNASDIMGSAYIEEFFRNAPPKNLR